MFVHVPAGYTRSVLYSVYLLQNAYYVGQLLVQIVFYTCTLRTYTEKLE